MHTTGYYHNAFMDRDMLRSAQDELTHDHPDARWASLSKREREVILLYAHPAGKDLSEVASILGISYDTAETHRRNACRKLGISNKAELVHAIRDNDGK